ncbi:hypothetical protein JOB18_004644 [Solea senegalensis]|uniref:Uncharacterized protein n=1 Tax=Solea senegalensis TaxID=28829 RepID=A0AAV6RCJ7_SOLSE|nr:hypothetical protein JOB18_004644 [Solea senegalensis]
MKPGPLPRLRSAVVRVKLGHVNKVRHKQKSRPPERRHTSSEQGDTKLLDPKLPRRVRVRVEFNFVLPAQVEEREKGTVIQSTNYGQRMHPDSLFPPLTVKSDEYTHI